MTTNAPRPPMPSSVAPLARFEREEIFSRFSFLFWFDLIDFDLIESFCWIIFLRFFSLECEWYLSRVRHSQRRSVGSFSLSDRCFVCFDCSPPLIEKNKYSFRRKSTVGFICFFWLKELFPRKVAKTDRNKPRTCKERMRGHDNWADEHSRSERELSG